MFYEWKPYVSVAERRANAKRYATRLAKQGRQLSPVEIAGRAVARTFWGKAWCDNLESYSDFANRLPRGRTYVRNGSVIDLQIGRGHITAIVAGSDIYELKIDVARLDKSCWKNIKDDCARSIDSLIDLLQGRFAKGVMERLTRQSGGLFPKPKEISVRCNCPDWAVLCKHAAAALYGVGARLDSDPELLFLLRGVNHCDLISQAVDGASLDAALASGQSNNTLASEDLGAIFGIDIEAADASPAKPPTRRAKSARPKPPKAKGAAERKKRAGETVPVGVKRVARKKTASTKKVTANPGGGRVSAKTKSPKKK